MYVDALFGGCAKDFAAAEVVPDVVRGGCAFRGRYSVIQAYFDACETVPPSRGFFHAMENFAATTAMFNLDGVPTS